MNIWDVSVGDVWNTLLSVFALLGAVLGVANSYMLLRQNRRHLDIYQKGDDSINRIYTDGGLTFVTMDLVILNTSARATFVVCKFKIQLPWKDDSFQIIPEPDHDGTHYRFLSDDSMATYPQEWVINHRIYQKGTLTQATPCLTGILIGRGGERIPSAFQHGSYIEVRTSVMDQKGKLHSANIELKVDRFGERDRP